MATVANIFVDQGADYSNIITVAAYNFTASVFSVASGQVRLQLTATASRSIPPGRYLYDVEITSPTNVRTRVVEGIVTVTPEITQI